MLEAPSGVCNAAANSPSCVSPSSNSRCSRGGNPCLCQLAMISCGVKRRHQDAQNPVQLSMPLVRLCNVDREGCNQDMHCLLAPGGSRCDAPVAGEYMAAAVHMTCRKHAQHACAKHHQIAG